MNRILSIVIAITLLYGCSECTMYASGIVKDLRSKVPIEGAVLSRSGESNITVVSDEDGEFEFDEVEGLSDCGKMQVTIEAPGYADQELIITNGAYVEIFLDTL